MPYTPDPQFTQDYDRWNADQVAQRMADWRRITGEQTAPDLQRNEALYNRWIANRIWNDEREQQVFQRWNNLGANNTVRTFNVEVPRGRARGGGTFTFQVQAPNVALNGHNVPAPTNPPIVELGDSILIDNSPSEWLRVCAEMIMQLEQGGWLLSNVNLVFRLVDEFPSPKFDKDGIRIPNRDALGEMLWRDEYAPDGTRSTTYFVYIYTNIDGTDTVDSFAKTLDYLNTPDVAPGGVNEADALRVYRDRFVTAGCRSREKPADREARRMAAATEALRVFRRGLLRHEYGHVFHNFLANHLSDFFQELRKAMKNNGRKGNLFVDDYWQPSFVEAAVFKNLRFPNKGLNAFAWGGQDHTCACRKNGYSTCTSSSCPVNCPARYYWGFSVYGAVNAKVSIYLHCGGGFENI